MVVTARELTPANERWLLSEEQPTIRYRTLTELLGRSEGDKEVREAKAAIMTSGPVPRILGKMSPGGYWGDPVRYYHDKYRGTVWSLIILAELRADGNDERIAQACEYILSSSQHRESGAFSYIGTLTDGGSKMGTLSCLTSNMVYVLNRLDHQNDERVKQAVSWLVENQRFATGCRSERTWPYHRPRCWSPRDCRSAAVKAVKAFNSIPEGLRTRALSNAIERGREFILEECLYGHGAGLKTTMRQDWFKLGYPHMWATDLLEIVSVILDSGLKDERLDEAIALIESKRNERGRWLQEGRFTDRYLVRLDRKGQESRFVTLEASRALKLFLDPRASI